MSTVVAILTALSAFLKPAERAASHKGAAESEVKKSIPE